MREENFARFPLIALFIRKFSFSPIVLFVFSSSL